MASAPTEITKTYPTRGPLQQFRLVQAMPFACFRCGQEKKAKLQTVYGGDWSRRLCNGCYGRLLSIYDVSSGTPADDEAAAALAGLLPSLVSEEDARAALRRRRYAMSPDEHLSAPAVQFLATADFIAEQLAGEESFEWSPAASACARRSRRRSWTGCSFRCASSAARSTSRKTPKTRTSAGWRGGGRCLRRSSRSWLPLVKWFLAIPHYIVLFFLYLAVIVVVIGAWFAILFTGRYPRGMFRFVEGVIRWHNRVVGYAFILVTDGYPPFSLRQVDAPPSAPEHPTQHQA